MSVVRYPSSRPSPSPPQHGRGIDTDDEGSGGRRWEGSTSRRRKTSMPPFFQERYLLGVAQGVGDHASASESVSWNKLM